MRVAKCSCVKLISKLTVPSGRVSMSQTGSVNPEWERQHLIWPIFFFFLESCMKMNEIGQRWGLLAPPLHPPKTTIKFKKNNNNLFTKKKTQKYVCAQTAKIFSGFVLIFCINGGTRNFTLIKVTPFACSS